MTGRADARPDAARWREASALLDETLELSGPARKELLDRACAGREELRRDVEALLAAETGTGVLDRPVAEYAARLLARPSASLSGRRLSHFLVGERIGAGGMGVVHRAVDEQLRREVALKFLPESALQDPVSRERLLREARAASALNHSGIVTVHEVGSAEGVDFIAMELVDGEPLSRRIPKKGLPVAAVLSYAAQIASALAVAHEKGILHRDLKPANLLVTRDERIKVLDFGLAKPLEEETPAVGARPGPPPGRSDPDGALTETGARVGTPQYMSPEQAWGLALDARSDVFSLGVVLYEMLTGEAPFRRRDATEAMAAIREHEPPPVEAVRPDVPVALAALVKRALSKDPAGRPATMRALLDELTAVERGLSRSRRVRLAIAATVAASIVAAGIFRLARETRRPEAPLPFELLSTFPGSHRQPSLAPDGRSIAFVQADAQGVPQLWTRPLGNGVPRKLTDDPHGVSHPRWSPRGVIVYAVRRQGIWAVPEGGGAPRRLVTSGVSPNLSRDGERLVYQRRTRLLVARSDGSGEVEIPGVRLRFRLGAAAPAFSPDGQEVVFFQDSDAPTIGDLSIVRVGGGGAPRRLTRDGVYVTDPVFTPDGKRILFSSERAGPLTLWEMDAAGGEPRALTSGSGEDSEADVSADGRRLVYANRKTTYLLSALDPATGARRTVAERRHLVTHPSFSPDGARLTYLTQEGRTFRVFVANADGSGERLLDLDPHHGYVLPAWSRDGRSIALYRMWPEPHFVRLDLSSGRIETVATDFPNDRHLGADVDVTNRLLVYPVIADDSRRTVVREIPTGAERNLAEPILRPRFAPDGASIAGGALDGSLKVCPPAGEPCRTLSPVGQDPVWTRGWIHFVRHGDVYGDADVQVVEVRRVRPDGTGEQHVADLPGAHPINFFYTVSPSSGEVVWSEYHPSPSELWTAVLPHRP